MTEISGPATVFVAFHDAAVEDFGAWYEEVRRQVAQAPGHVHVSSAEDAQRAVALTFETEHALQHWLDSADWAHLLDAGVRRGIRREYSDLVVVEGKEPPTGVAMFLHQVRPDDVAGFIEAQRALMDLNAAASGYEYAILLGPRSADDGNEEWTAVLKFRNDALLAEWIESPDRASALGQLRSHLTQEYSSSFERNTFGSIVRVKDGKSTITPNWKVAMMVLLVLYPTVMTLSRFVGPVLDGWGAEPWLSMWLSQILSVSLLTYALMPLATWVFGFWLDPDRGSSVRVSVLGVAVVCLVYALTLTVFARVRWLQFWDYV